MRYHETDETPQQSSRDAEYSDDQSEHSFRINSTSHAQQETPRVLLRVADQDINWLIDTGTALNIISEETFKRFDNQKLTTTTTRIRSYNSEVHLKVLGTFNAEFKHVNQQMYFDIYVTEGRGESLLSCGTAQQLGLIHFSVNACMNLSVSANEVKEKFPNLCRGIGELKGHTVSLHIDKTVPPVAVKHRRTPIHLKQAVEQEIMRLERDGIIEKATGPTPWVSPIVIVPRTQDPARIRLCIDMRQPNKAILRERHPSPTIDDIMADLNGKKVFSKIDLKDGYHQLVLDEDSRFITTFSTHIGLYRYKRLSFGINSASEIFQNTIRQLLINIPNVLNYSDDILVYGETQHEHDLALNSVLKTLCDQGLTINLKKCMFSQRTIKFFGYIFTEKGIQPDPEKVRAILNLQPPSNVHETRSLLGMLNYVGKFLENLATTTAPIRGLLLKKNEMFEWSEPQHQAFEKLKHQLATSQGLAYYNPNKATMLTVDAGPNGLGAILAQKQGNRVVIIAYASKTLSDVEKRYSQIEKETLAVTWAIKHFHIYLFGSHFELYTDHKPLVTILKNPRSAPSARIERLLLQIQSYKFDVYHQKGSENPSDYLSRHPAPELVDNRQIECYANFIMSKAIPKLVTLQEIQTATKKDATLSMLTKVLTENDQQKYWNRKELQPYWLIKSELTVVNDCILRQHRLVIPQSMQERIIELAHQGHQGITKTKQLLRSKVWFPFMEKKTEDYIRSCPICQVITEDTRRDPIQTWLKAHQPFEYLSIDFLGPLPNGKYFLIIVDEFSKFPFVEILNSTSCQQVTPILSRLFTLFGFPSTVQSDNGPPFNGVEFKSWLEKFNIKHQAVTPRWPQANGTPERFIKTITKAIVSGTLESSNIMYQLEKFLINYRSTPHQTTGIAPSELFLNRKIRGYLPVIDTNNKEIKVDNKAEERVNMRNEKFNSKKNVREHDFQIGDLVICKQQRRNKLTPKYAPTLLTISSIRGTQITAKDPQGKRLTRNSSFFKKFVTSSRQQTANSSPTLLSNELTRMSSDARQLPPRTMQSPRPTPGQVSPRTPSTPTYSPLTSVPSASSRYSTPTSNTSVRSPFRQLEASSSPEGSPNLSPRFPSRSHSISPQNESPRRPSRIKKTTARFSNFELY